MPNVVARSRRRVARPALRGCAAPRVKPDADLLARQSEREHALASAAGLAACGPARRFERKDGGSGSLQWHQDGDAFRFSVHAPVTGKTWVLERRCASRGARRLARAAGRRRRRGRVARARARLARAGRAADRLGARGARERRGEDRVSQRRLPAVDRAGWLEDRISRLRQRRTSRRCRARCSRAAATIACAFRSASGNERGSRRYARCDPPRACCGAGTRNAAAWTDAVREQRIASRRAGTDAAIVAAVLRLASRRACSMSVAAKAGLRVRLRRTDVASSASMRAKR